jgi:hypothetical protein
MSHIVTVETQVRDPVALTAACLRLQLPPPQQRTVRLYSGAASGWAVELPGWKYPAVCDVAHGRLQYDNYNGEWGHQSHLDRLLQAYAIEKTRLEARRRGHSVTEQSLPDGSIRLTVQVGV